MPTSWYHAIPYILNQVLIEQPASILDVGIGFGKYGLLLRESLEVAAERYTKKEWQIRIDGIEAFEGYRNPIHDYVYDQIDYRPIEDALPSLGRYDVILLIDVLEHFDRPTGAHILKELLAHTNKALIVSTPVIPSEQKDYQGNTYETHKSRWSVIDFACFDQNFALMDIGSNKVLIVKLFPNEALIKQNKSLRKKDSLLTAARETVHTDTTPLKIGYVLPHKALTGGMKILLEQMRWLKSRGHHITAVLRSSKGDTSALPLWNRPPINQDIVIKPHERYDDAVKNCDVVVAGWAEQLPELCDLGKPIVYTEQGSELLFGDLRVVRNVSYYREKMADIYSTSCYYCAVSDFVADILKNRFGRQALVLPNSVDTELFHPGTPPNKNVILMVGNPALPFKGFETALKALEMVWNMGLRFEVNWVCQHIPDVAGNSYPIHPIVNAAQQDIPQLYRDAAIFLFSSWYEGFGMPPLEAMSSGLPVICTNCGGSSMYLKPLRNALVVPPGDERAMAAAIHYLLLNKNDIRASLSRNARETALDFSVDRCLVKLESLLYKALATYS